MSLTLMAVEAAQPMQDMVVLAQSQSSAPQLQFEFPDKFVDLARLVAAFAALIWVAYIILKNILPGGGGMGRGLQAMMGQGMSGGKIAMAVLGIVCLMDVNMLITMTNFLLEFMWSIKESAEEEDLVS